jgi:hypothetical protein
MRFATAGLLALVIAWLPASAAFGDAPKRRSSKAVRIAVDGYVQPQLAVRYRPDALPRDEVEFGMGDTRAGLIFKGRIYDSWRFKVHFVIGGEFLEALIGLDAVDRDGDGAIDTVATKAERVAGLAIEELSVTWQPIHFFQLRAGQMRIPFTAAHRSANTALMFPGRSAPNDVFLRGSDQASWQKSIWTAASSLRQVSSTGPECHSGERTNEGHSSPCALTAIRSASFPSSRETSTADRFGSALAAG